MDALNRAVESRSVIFIVGAGVSAAITNNSDTATWIGLIRSGSQRVSDLNPLLTEKWSKLVDSTIQYGLEQDDSEALIRAAGMVKTEFARIGDQAYADWLEADIGKLSAQAPDIGSSLLSLHFPVLTTNYDSLLEKIGDRESALWTSPKGIQRVLNGAENSIAHLHGIWSEPSSIVLSEGDYAAHLKSPAIQELQRAASSIKSIVYVGFGSGLSDPNFSSMLKWHRDLFPQSGIRHFRLCLDSEASELESTHAADNIDPVAYGKDHADLAAFLDTLKPAPGTLQVTPAGIARDVIADAQQYLVDDLRADIVIAEDAPPERDMAELVLPPVLLPVPHAEYIKARSSKNKDERIERLDPYQETREADFLVLVADEGQGLTTTLKWLAWHASRELAGAAPLYVNFRQCRRAPKPLEEQVRQAARSAGIALTRGAALPPYVLALDDFSPHVQKVSDRVIEELAKNGPILTLVGCRQGHEDDLMERLRNSGVNPRVRYLGSLGAADIRALAKIASPTRYREVAESVIDILGAESLPRTPFTASLLISILLHNMTLASVASQTAVLEQYVGLLLGRGDPHEDARFSIDQPGRESILANLADRFVSDALEALPESEVVSVLEDLFQRFGWTESAIQLLQNFIDRRVLRRVGGQSIQFSRSSYLFLFAAKRAVASSEFLNRLMDRPLRYAPILMPYAALSRNDHTLLERVFGLVEEATQEALEKGSPYQQMPLEPPHEPSDSDNASDDREESVEDDDENEAADPPEAAHGDDGYFDFVENERSLVLGDVDDGAPPIVRLMQVLELSSSVLRDADQIEDLELKRSALARVLAAWGAFVSALSTDRTLLDFISRMADDLQESDLSEAAHPSKHEFLDEFAKTFPATMALGGIGATLASRKLLVVLQAAIDSGELSGSDESTIATTFLIFAIREPGWPGQLRKLLASQGNIWIIRYFVFWLCASAYVNQAVADQDEDDLVELCVEIIDRGTRYSDNRERAANLNRIRQELKRLKLRRSRRINTR